jgi:hypothetical protein
VKSKFFVFFKSIAENPKIYWGSLLGIVILLLGVGFYGQNALRAQRSSVKPSGIALDSSLRAEMMTQASVWGEAVFERWKNLQGGIWAWAQNESVFEEESGMRGQVPRPDWVGEWKHQATGWKLERSRSFQPTQASPEGQIFQILQNESDRAWMGRPGEVVWVPAFGDRRAHAKPTHLALVIAVTEGRLLSALFPIDGVFPTRAWNFSKSSQEGLTYEILLSENNRIERLGQARPLPLSPALTVGGWNRALQIQGVPQVKDLPTGERVSELEWTLPYTELQMVVRRTERKPLTPASRLPSISFEWIGTYLLAGLGLWGFFYLRNRQPGTRPKRLEHPERPPQDSAPLSPPALLWKIPEAPQRDPVPSPSVADSIETLDRSVENRVLETLQSKLSTRSILELEREAEERKIRVLAEEEKQSHDFLYKLQTLSKSGTQRVDQLKVRRAFLDEIYELSHSPLLWMKYLPATGHLQLEETRGYAPGKEPAVLMATLGAAETIEVHRQRRLGNVMSLAQSPGLLKMMMMKLGIAHFEAWPLCADTPERLIGVLVVTQPNLETALAGEKISQRISMTEDALSSRVLHRGPEVSV